MTRIILLMFIMYLGTTIAGNLDCEYEKETTKNKHFWQNKAKEYAEKLCENMGYTNKKGGMFEKKDSEFENCVKLMEPLIKETKTEEVDADNFGKYCKNHKIKAKDAEDILKTLKPYCWRMSDIAKLPNLINHKIVKIRPQEWNNLQYDMMDLELCLNDLRTDEKEKVGSKINVLENYRKMFTSGFSKCNCVEVIGFNDIYDKLKGNDEYGSIKSLYEETCFRCSKRKKSYTKDQLEAVSSFDLSKGKYSEINLKKIIAFLMAAEPYGLSMSGWFTKNVKNTEWPLSFLIEQSRVNDKFDWQVISTMAEAINNGYTHEKYDEFIIMTSADKYKNNIGTWECRRDIVRVFNLDQDRQQMQNYIDLFYGSHKQAIGTANKLLNRYLDFASYTTRCSDFINDIKKINNIFYNGNIFYKGTEKKSCSFLVSHDEMFKFLSEAAVSGRSLNDVFNCLTIIEGVEKEFDSGKAGLISNSKNLNGSEYNCFKTLVLKDLTKKIFEDQRDGTICKIHLTNNEPTQNKANIFKLYKKLYKVEREFNDLSELFEYKSSKPEEGSITLLK